MTIADLEIKIESYGFECEAGPMTNCTDWIAFKIHVAELEGAIVTLRAAHTNVIQTPVKNAASISRMALAETDGILKP